MRIVDICAFYTPHGGGVKTYVERKLQAARPGHEQVIVVAPGTRDTMVDYAPAGRLITVSGPQLPVDRRYHYFKDEAALHDLLDRLDPDVVEVSSPWASPAMVARWRGRALRSLVMHADPLSAYPYRWFGKLASRDNIDRGFEFFWRHLRRLDQQFDVVVSAGASLTARLTDGGMRKVQTIPMGVTPGLFAPALRDEGLRARLLARCGLDSDATLLIGLGRLAPEKRWPMVIEAVTAAGYDHPIGLVLFGNGRERTRVIRAAANNPHVQLIAPIADRRELATVLASADALVHGCEAETFCMVAAEAKASGLPLIVPDAGGASDQFVSGQGELYEACSSARLADAVRRFMTSAPLMQRGRATAAAPFVQSMDEHFLRLFESYAQRMDKRVNAA
ncbi:glycosyltransferase [Novosphingobium sp. G106]|uniref:glycosyltransferase n=1 Tax=Novosphingobium sp. G106 TaxID=2849500 RepID=UPI001C2DBFE9|nr:glycosyltransferase [Novosphingobium sp. G106]MBV1692615.1 glycosyltransferase [Novosphingobium sp. G106]